MIVNLFTFFSALLISWLLLYPLVWLLHAFKLGQPIRLEGPAAHQAKAGTPTMGGLGFILAITLMLLVMIDYDIYPKYLGLIVLLLGFGGIGLIDDLLKIKRGKNLGLTFWQKILSQIIVAGLFGWLIITTGEFLPTSSWLWQFGFGEPLLYQLLTIFLVIGAANATNLTDGLNGLLAGTGTIAYLAFAVIAGCLLATPALTVCLIVAGAVLAFIHYNFPHAKVFMGDVGSLPIGAVLAGIAIILHQELRLAVVGGVFVVEALSVILQVTSFKLFRRRPFRMAPLHHHFELLGIKEWVVVVGFWAVALILGIIGIVI